ncbi:TIGR04282 family arsenosugar biosynthesis glycosyltransferase [Pseudooceanicola nitratireducens]|uniref:TIGR04282 family arsenosugar biosynthesis glycosyltransferase n=2 Tax=Pseudooceanicola nitratireducens TaxID=517719 RepID=UPI003512F15A
MPARPRLVVMVKDPRPGRVKTRLAADIGAIPATWWMRHQLRGLLRRLRDPRWDLVLAVAPNGAVASPVFPHDLARVAQGPGDLGDRMGRLLRNRPSNVQRAAPALGGGSSAARRSRRAEQTSWAAPCCIIGADIPGITPAHIARAFQALRGSDAVFGPAPDGGYWLIGMRGVRPPPPGLFQGVRWSTDHALSDTLSTLPNHRIALVDTLRDVDTAADLA